MQKTLFFAVFQRKIKPLSHTWGKKFIVSFDFLKVHIHNGMMKRAPRQTLSQRNKSNLPFFRK